MLPLSDGRVPIDVGVAQAIYREAVNHTNYTTSVFLVTYLFSYPIDVTFTQGTLFLLIVKKHGK